MKLTLHVLADGIAVTLIALFALGLSSGEFLPSGRGRLFAEIWIYTLPIAAAGHWLLPRSYRFVAEWQPPAQWLALVAQLAVIGFFGSLLGSTVVYALDLEPGVTFAGLLSLTAKLAIYLAVLVGFLHALVVMLRNQLVETQNAMYVKELEAERALALAAEARLASLESHVHPHFLFNTLNTISSLVETAPLKAERLIERVSSLLRFSLSTRERRLVPLDHELRIVEDYLEIERERFGERLRFKIEADAECVAYQVPPLSVQTLVENCVKHAVAPSRSGAEINVRAKVAAGALVVEVADTGPGFSMDDRRPNGHGLENLRDRLAALFGGQARLSSTRSDGWTRVSFSVPSC